MSFNLTLAQYNELHKTMFGDSGRGNQAQAEDDYDVTRAYLEQFKQPEEQGFVGDFVDSVQMGAWKGFSDLARGVGSIFNSEWLNDAADRMAEKAEENKQTMSTKMREALGQSALGGDGEGVENIYWWAGNLGSFLGQNIDTVLTLGAGKIGTTALKGVGKFAGKKVLGKEMAEQIGQAVTQQAARRGIPAKYHRTLGLTAVMSAMGAGGRASQVQAEIGQLSDEQLAQVEGFREDYWALKESEEGQGLDDRTLFDSARKRFAMRAGRDAALNPAAIATDVAVNAISGLGGGLWGLAKPAKGVGRGLLKGAMVEGGTEGLQGTAETYAVNSAAREHYDPSRSLTEGMQQNVIDSAILGSVFGSAMGGLDARGNQKALVRERKRIIEAINTGDSVIDEHLRKHAEMINNAANDLDDLISQNRFNSMHTLAQREARAKQAMAEAQQQAIAEEQVRQQEELAKQEETAKQQELARQEELAKPFHHRDFNGVLEQFRQDGLEENEIDAFIESNIKKATNDLAKFDVSSFKMGADYQKSLAQKKAYQENFADAQHRLAYWQEAQQRRAEQAVTSPSIFATEPEAVIPTIEQPQAVGFEETAVNDNENVATEEGLEPVQYEDLSVQSDFEHNVSEEISSNDTLSPTNLNETQQQHLDGFRADSVAYESDIMQQNKLADFLKFANVRKKESLENLPISRKADAFEKLLKSGFTPSFEPLMGNRFNQEVQRQELDALHRRMQRTNTIYQQNGKPFRSEKSAQEAMAKYGVTETHEILKAEDGKGFVLTRLPPAAQWDLQRKKLGIPSYMEAQEQAIAELGLDSKLDEEGDLSEAEWEQVEQKAKQMIEDAQKSVGNAEFKFSRSTIPTTVEENFTRGSQAMRQAIETQQTVRNAMYRESLGWVDFEWGTEGKKSENSTKRKGAKGVSHIIEKRMNIDNMSYDEAITFLTKDIPEIIALGKIERDYQVGDSRSVAIIHNGMEVHLVKNGDENAWLLTGFIQKNNDQTVNQSRGATTSDLRTSSPILSRTSVGAFGNDNLLQTHAQIKQIVGDELAGHFEVITRAEAERLIGKKNVDGSTEALYSKTGKIFIVDENIRGNSVLSRDERLKWVAWHELAHRGVQVKFANQYNALMTKIDQNTTVRELADAIQQQREETRDNRLLAVEEALAEFNAAYTTGKMEELKSRYGIKVPPLREKQLKSWLEITAQRIREFVARLFGKERAEQFSNDDLLNLLKDVQQNMGGEIEGNVEGNVNVESDIQTKLSLNEDPHSSFAKAVDTVSQGGKPSQQYIPMGSTPAVLKMLGIADTKVLINRDVLSKVMGDKHNVTPETLKQLPSQLNNPVAVMKSAPQATQQGYVVLTELIEENAITGQQEPVISALHLKTAKDGIEVINIASVYGKNLRGLQNMLNHDLLYWNKEKGSQFVDAFGLQLPSKIASNNVSQSAGNIKTETDLSQYQNSQIKSATDNTGAFDGGNEDIRHSMADIYNVAKAKISDLIKKVRSDKNINERIDLLPVTEEEVRVAKEHGLDISGYTHLYDSSAINHIIKNHGDPQKEKMRGNVGVTDKDFEVALDVIVSPDKVIYGAATKRGLDSIVYVKRLDDGSTVVVEEQRTGHKKLALTTMFKYPLGTHDNSIMNTLRHYVRNGTSGVKNSVVEKPFSSNPNPEYKFSRTQSNVEKLRKINESTPLENMTDMAKAMASRPLSEWKSLMLEYGKRANTKIFDALAPIKYAEDKAGIKDHSQSAYTAARLAAGSASISEASMLYGLPEYREGIIQRKNGTTEQDALFGILQSLGNDVNDFLAWIAGNRADKLMKEGRENHLSQAEINELKALNKGKEAQFEQARQKFMAWNQSLLDLAEDAGLINKEDRAKWEDKDFYIPFYRESEDGDAIAPYRNKGLSGQSAGIKRLKGSDKAVNDLLENVITNATKLIDASVKNIAMTKAVTNLADTGVITLIENPTSFDWKKLGSNKHGADKDGGVAMVRIDGKEQLVRINDAMLFNAITSIDQQPLDYPFRKLLAGPKRVLTATVTSMPNFIVRNFLRDMAQAWVVDRNNGFKLGVDSIKGLKDAYKNTGSSIDLMFAGASFGAGYVNGGNPQEAAVHIRNHLRKKGKTAAEIEGFMEGVIFTKDKLSSVLDRYFHLNHAAENANRIAVYDRAIASGKSKAQAALESKDLMDFSMHGSAKALRILGDVLPFFNARLQGMSQLGRAFKENPRALATRGAMIALASVALAAMNQGEDWYEEQGDDIKDNFWLANLGGQIIKIPKPFELGVVFGTVPERLYRTMSGADSTGRFKERLLSAITNTLSLNPIPQAVKPMFEVYNNYDSFRGREIETLSDRRLMKEARYDDRTSLVSRSVAGLTSAFGLSPKQTDYLIHGYFGTLGMYVLGMSDLAIRKAGGYGELPAKNWQEYPVLDAVFGGDVAVPRKYTRYMNDYYNFLNQVSEISATVKSYKDDGRVAESNQLKMENERLLNYKPVLSQTQKKLKAIKAEMDMIQNNPNFSAEQKRQRLDRLRENKNAIVRMVVERMEKEDF